MKWLKAFLEFYKETWKKNYISNRILFIICMISFAAIVVSVFDSNLDGTGNLVTIRTIFSSIIGYMLESSTKQQFKCSKNGFTVRNIIVSSVSVITTVVIIISYILNINVNNPSLILLKNVLFSSVGFLISASKSCGE